MKLLALLSEYAGTMSLQAKSETTIKTEEVHIRHMERFLQATKNKRITVRELNVKFFLKYKQYRYDKGVRTDTVNKELTTFQLMMQYAVDNAYVKENIVKRVKKDPSQVPDFCFRTNSEILEALKTGKHTKREEKEIKRYRYLTPEEIKRLASIAEGTPKNSRNTRLPIKASGYFPVKASNSPMINCTIHFKSLSKVQSSKVYDFTCFGTRWPAI